MKTMHYKVANKIPHDNVLSYVSMWIYYQSKKTKNQMGQTIRVGEVVYI